MSFLPPSPTLKEHLAYVGQHATDDTWIMLRTGVLIRMDITAQTELDLRACRDADSFKAAALAHSEVLS